MQTQTDLTTWHAWRPLMILLVCTSGIMSYFIPTLPDIIARSLFLNYDTNNSGQLEYPELKRLLFDDLSLRSDEAETYKHILLLDKDGDGRVSYNEFVSWLRSGENLQLIGDSSRYTRVRKAIPVDYYNMFNMFKQYDTDGSQFLDRQEFQRVFLNARRRPGFVNDEAYFMQLDADRDGVISFHEFESWLAGYPSWP